MKMESVLKVLNVTERQRHRLQINADDSSNKKPL